MGAALTVGLFGGIFALVAAEKLAVDIWSIGPLAAFHDWVHAVDLGLSGFDFLAILMTLGFGIVGLSSVARGLPAFIRAASLWSRDPVPVGDLHLHEGAVEVEGVAEPMDEFDTLRSHYSGTECLAYRYEEKERRNRMSRRDRWRTTEQGSRRRPFRVTGDNGTVVVEPDGATLTCGRDIVNNSGRTIRTEWRLEPGESVYVSGTKLDGTDGSGPGGARTYIGDGGGSFTVSDADERWTILRFLAKGVVLSVTGLVLLGVAVFFASTFVPG